MTLGPQIQEYKKYCVALFSFNHLKSDFEPHSARLLEKCHSTHYLDSQLSSCAKSLCFLSTEAWESCFIYPQSSTLIALDALCTNRLWSLLVQHLTSSVHTLSSGVRSKARSPNAWGSNKHKSQWLLSFSKFSGIFSFSLSVHLFFSFLPLQDLNSVEVILYQNQKRFIDIKICIYSLQ